jgi:hypothetical protein
MYPKREKQARRSKTYFTGISPICAATYWSEDLLPNRNGKGLLLKKFYTSIGPRLIRRNNLAQAREVPSLDFDYRCSRWTCAGTDSPHPD